MIDILECILFLTPSSYLTLSIMSQMSFQHSVFSLNYIHFVSAGSFEMEWEYTCQGKLFLSDLLECVSFVALMKGLVVCGWYQSLSHSRPLTNPKKVFSKCRT